MSCDGRFEVGLHGLGRGQLRRGRLEGLDGEQRVDRRRLGLGLGEAVARGQRRLLEDADAINQAIEMLAEPRDCRGRRSGDSSRVSSARSNSALARSRWPSASSFWPASKCLSDVRDQDARSDRELELAREPAAATGAGGWRSDLDRLGALDLRRSLRSGRRRRPARRGGVILLGIQPEVEAGSVARAQFGSTRELRRLQLVQTQPFTVKASPPIRRPSLPRPRLARPG